MHDNISFISSAQGGYIANLFTLTQVYAGAAVGMRRPGRNDDEVKCKKELSWVNKLCTEVGSKLRNFLRCGCWCGVTLVCAVAVYEKSLRFPEGFAFTMVEQKLLTANTIYANSVEIKLTRNWLAVITFCESPNKKS